MSQSRSEILLEALLNGTTADITPQSRSEEYLLALLNGVKDLPTPQSRIEAYYYALCQRGLGDGSGGSTVEGITATIELVLASGNQVVTAPDGKLYKTVTIEKPETLIPENIVKDVNIAGVVGSHVDSEPVLQDKTITENGTYIPEEGVDGFDSVTVNVPDTPAVVQQLNVTENGTYTPSDGVDGFNSVVVAVSSTDETDYFTQLMKNTLSECSSNVENIRIYAFYSCSTLTSVNFPACTSIGSSAFGSCAKLSTVNFPECVTIEQSAFYRCYSLKTLSFPKCENIKNTAFADCRSITEINFPVCTVISTGAFGGCSGVVSVSCPECTTLGIYAFSGCSKLETVSFPKCTSIGNYAFSKCSKLSAIYLMSTDICTLASTYAFSSAGITSSTGSIYVPSSLVASYKAATNWAYFSNRIFAAEE